jgi:hypothetical protein
VDPTTATQMFESVKRVFLEKGAIQAIVAILLSCFIEIINKNNDDLKGVLPQTSMVVDNLGVGLVSKIWMSLSFDSNVTYSTLEENEKR